jgi:large subunit ribosomal protein L33
MAKKNLARTHIMVACAECKERNYATTKNKKNDPERIEIKKHCPKCNKHTVHKETK